MICLLLHPPVQRLMISSQARVNNNCISDIKYYEDQHLSILEETYVVVRLFRPNGLRAARCFFRASAATISAVFMQTNALRAINAGEPIIPEVP